MLLVIQFLWVGLLSACPRSCIMSPGERDEKIERLLDAQRARLKREWPTGPADVTEIEERVARIERESLREITEAMIHEQTGKREGNRTACPCGKGSSTYRSQSSIDLVTAFGRVATERAYFYCTTCRDGHCPQDRAWGIGPGNTTPTVQSMVGYLAVQGAYTQVPATLKRLRPQIHLGTKTVELIAQALGKAVTQDPPMLSQPAERPLAAAVDGAILLTRGEGKEVRCGMIYEPDWEAGRDPEAVRGLRKEFVATVMGSRDELIKEVCRRVERRRPSPETKVAALGDGAPWIWRGYAKYLPNREEILDFYHVCEHLQVVAKAWYGEGNPAGGLWIARMKGEIKGGGAEGLLRSIRAWKPATSAARKVKARELAYFRKNRQRMNYHVYLRNGLPIGSGCVEGACKHVVGDRFKRTGMRWNPATAEPLIHLRAALLTHPDLDLRRYVPRHVLA